MKQLLDYFVPENYQLTFHIDKDKEDFSGITIIKGQVKSSSFSLHAENMQITLVRIDQREVEYGYDGHLLNLESELGDHKIEIYYQHPLNKNMEGLYLSTYKYQDHDEKIATTQFESHYAREAFPCIDEPAAKATFDLKIKSSDEKDLILANTPQKSENDGYKIFETTPKMSTYLVAFVVGKFHGKTIKNKHGVEITTYAALNQPLDSVDFANEVAAGSLEYYDDEFGVKYPLQKCDQVALPDFEAGAMENWGLVTYRESMLLADKTATISVKKSIALTVSHELSHQWFGDLVTMKWWDDLWLNESFASIMEYMATDALYPEFNIWENFFTRDCLSALKRDAYYDVQSVHQDVENVEDIANLFDGAIVYSKGARLMLMLIRAMGWDSFKKGLKDYFEKFAYQNTIGDDLWKSLNPYADFDVKKFMHAWIEQPGYPVVNAKIFEGYLQDQIPDDVESAIIKNQEPQQLRFLLDGELKPSDWPIPHLLDDMSGHYLIDIDEADFAKKIAKFDQLSLEQKLRLLIDRDYLAKTDLVSSASLIELLPKFKSETSAAVWSVIATIIGGLKIFFDPESAAEKKFKKYVGDLVIEQLKRLGLKTRPQDSENDIRLRSIILALDYYAENETNLKTLAAEYQDDLTLLDSEIRSDILDAKLYLEPEMLDVYLEKYQKETDPEIQDDLFFAMMLTKNQDNLEKLIKLLNEPKIVKPQDHLYLYIYLFRNPKASLKTLDWLTQNWEYIKKMTGDKTIADYPRYTANSIRTEEEKKLFWQFFEGKKNDSALVRTLKIAETEINARLRLIATDKKAVEDQLFGTRNRT